MGLLAQEQGFQALFPALSSNPSPSQSHFLSLHS